MGSVKYLESHTLVWEWGMGIPEEFKKRNEGFIRTIEAEGISLEI